MHIFYFFFFQAEDGIRDVAVTGVQTCALPICSFSTVVAVLDTIVENEPPEVDLSIAYPDIVPEGAVQLRSICDEETVVAVNPVGEPGGVGEGVAVLEELSGVKVQASTVQELVSLVCETGV